MENESKKSEQIEIENHRLLTHFLQALIKEQNLEVPSTPLVRPQHSLSPILPILPTQVTSAQEQS